MAADGAVRRHVDARLVSYALSVLGERKIGPELQMTFIGCAGAALQAASGLVALSVACRAAAESPVLAARLDARQLNHVQALLEGLGSTVDECWKGDLKELFEVIVVLACESASTVDEEVRFRQWAQGVFLDTRPLAVLDDNVQADVELDQTPEAKRHRVRKPRSSKDTYQQERLENLVHKAIALGVKDMRPIMISGTIVVVGFSARSKEEKLLKVRGSMSEAKTLCTQANEEIRRMDVVETAM